MHRKEQRPFRESAFWCRTEPEWKIGGQFTSDSSPLAKHDLIPAASPSSHRRFLIVQKPFSDQKRRKSPSERLYRCWQDLHQSAPQRAAGWSPGLSPCCGDGAALQARTSWGAPLQALTEAQAASGLAGPKGERGWEGWNKSRSCSRDVSRPSSFLEMAIGSCWCSWRISPKSCSGSFSTGQILQLAVQDWAPPPPFLSSSFKRSLILLSNQAISFAKQLQGPFESGGPASLFRAGFGDTKEP